MKSIALSSALLAGLLASVIVSSAPAAERERGINARQHFQQQRMQQGVRQGDLTRGEARSLQREARNVRQEERTFRSDGRFTAGERTHVNRDLDRLSRDIHRERHDGNRQFGFRGSDNRFAYRGNGNAFGRQGTDRRFWGPGAERRFGNHGGHPRFGDQWGHPSRHAASRIDRMQAQQHRRIVQGIRSGELTPREAQRLRAEQRMIRREERVYLADGVLSPWERRDLYRDLNAARQHIYNETHDAWRR